MHVPKEVSLLQIAEETSYLEQQVESHTADQLRRLAILEHYGSKRPESYPDPVRHTTRSVAAVLSDIERASAERLMEMREDNSRNEGPEIRAARSARFAAQRMAECEAIQAVSMPQVATRYQLPEHSSPFIAPDEYRFLQGGLQNPPSNWQRPQSLPENVPGHTQSTPNPSAHLAIIDPSLCDLSMKTDGPSERDQSDLYLFKDLINCLSPLQENTPTPQAQPVKSSHPQTILPAIPRRMSTPSTQSNTTSHTLYPRQNLTRQASCPAQQRPRHQYSSSPAWPTSGFKKQKSEGVPSASRTRIRDQGSITRTSERRTM